MCAVCVQVLAQALRNNAPGVQQMRMFVRAGGECVAIAAAQGVAEASVMRAS